MHMADALLSPIVGGVMFAVSTASIAYSVVKIKKDDMEDKKVPIMGVMGAFIFAAQMINFTIPVTGSSGHIGGGILLAALLGKFPAFLTITAVLIIQALFFADGGLLALGCNIFNMGIITCFFAYPLLFKPLVKKGLNFKSITIASVISVIISLQIGSFFVVLETWASGITKLPFSAFIALMQPIHLAIGVMEGIITAAVLYFVWQMRPEILESANNRTKMNTISIKKVMLTLIIITVLMGGAFSILASSHPDGLEWSMEKVLGTTDIKAEGGIFDIVAYIQKRTSFMPDYDFKSAGDDGSVTGSTVVGNSVAGLMGGGLTFIIAGVTGLMISVAKKKKKKRLRYRA